MNTPQKKILPSPEKSVDWLKHIDHDHRRLVVPVGSLFQVSVPKWTNRSNERNPTTSCDSGTSMWLGTRIWPIQDTNFLTGEGKIGKGRPDSCSCTFPGFTQCVNLHISEAKRRLQYELGPAYKSWKFDEMGEDVGKSWTPTQKTRFDHLVMTRPLSEGKTFLKKAESWFPSKKRKDIVSYYLNVHVPNRIRTVTRSGCKEFDSDDDEIGEARNVGNSLKRSMPYHIDITQLVRSHYLTGRR